MKALKTRVSNWSQEKLRRAAAPRFSSLVILLLGLGLIVGSAGCSSTARPAASHHAQAVPPASANSTNIVKGNPDALAHFAAGVSYEFSDSDEKALQEFDRAAMEDPGHEPLVLELSQRYLRTHQPEKAIALLAHSAERTNASASVYSWLARADVAAGRTNAAVAAGRKAMEKDPQSIDAYEGLLEACMRNGQLAEASRVLNRAAVSVRREAAALIAVADLYTGYVRAAPKDQEARARAVELLDTASEMKFASPRLWQRVGELYARLGETKKAAAVYEKLLSQSVDASAEQQSFREQLAQIYLQADDKTNALKELRAIVREDPTRFPNAWFALGEIAQQDGLFADAVDDFQNAIRAKPELEPAYYDLAVSLANLHRTEDAEKTLETARNRFSNGYRYEYYSALVQREAKNYPEAIRHFIAAETIAKATAPVLLDKSFYFEFGAAYERNHQYEEADQYLQKAVDLDPSFSEAANYLGYMLAERGEQLPRARTLIEQAIKADPKNGAFLDSMGWVLFKLNLPGQALPWMLKAVAAEPEPDATVLDHLGDVYMGLRQVDKALDAWKRSLAVEPNNDVKRKLNMNSGS